MIILNFCSVFKITTLFFANLPNFASSEHFITALKYFPKKVKRYCIAVNGSIPWHRYGVSLAIWDHTVLPATRHKWTHPALTPAMQASTWFTYPGGMGGWVDLVDLIAPWPGVEPATFRSWVRRPTTAPPRQLLKPTYEPKRKRKRNWPFVRRN